MLKDKYEISLWEDYVVPEAGGIPEHYEERKIAIIGSNEMTSQIKVVEPRLVNNINGTNTLTFKLYYVYTDYETGKKVSNPFIKLLVNERKVKCFWKNVWYDLVVKGIQEDSGGKSITYTCKDLFVNELSKTGFNLEFNNELQNNQGSVQYLGAKILEGTDWQLGDEQDVIQQTVDEALYEVMALTEITGRRSDRITEIKIPKNEKFYVFYSVVQDQKLNCQFIYEPDGYVGKTDLNSQLLIDVDCSYVDLTKWDIDADGARVAYIGNTQVFKVEKNKNVSLDYRGSRLVRSPVQEYDPLLERYCYLYKDSNEREIYKYITTEYKDPTVVLNLINNAKDFSNTNGWIGESLSWTLYPPFYNQTNLEYNANTYLKITNGQIIFNTGLQNSSMYITDGFQKGENYIFRVKGKTGTSTPSGSNLSTSTAPSCRICDYTNDGTKLIKIPVSNSDYFTYSSPIQNGEWIEYTLTCKKSIPRAKITTQKMGFFLIGKANVWLQEIQLFKYVEGKNESDNMVRINPGDMDRQSVATEVYCYYYKNQAKINKNDIEFLYKNTVDWTGNSTPTAIYNDNYEKIRSIEAKNSNRFNLLQTLAETFECWVRFKIDHDQNTGRILYTNGLPNKKVYFKKDVGQETGIGFIYGIDLRTISRTINSDQITTKVIVVPNTNEYAENGVCEIAQSELNYSKENFILNFDYYENQGLLDRGQVEKDLYLTTDDVIGYYYWLKEYNTEYYQIADELVAKKSEFTRQNSLLKSSEEQLTALQQEITSLQNQIAQLAGLSSYNATRVMNYLKTHKDNTDVKTRVTNLKVQTNAYNNLNTETKALKKSVDAIQKFIDTTDDRQKELRSLINAKHEQFYKKYSRFIQEGSWSSQDYLDENLYYLDAQSVAYTSSRPQITYNISVLRLSALPEYQSKVFNIGDITYIQDTEFFGYTYVGEGRIRTPYKEKSLISEVTSNFDSPQNDTFKVQNYKTQFEDLFQRITATTQSLQYATGEYNRAANIVESNGVINNETLQNSLLINQDLVTQSQNEQIYKDSTGITLTDKTDSSKKTKITSRGIFITTDGGVTWKNAVRGDGIATQYLTAGAINVNNITILDGDAPTFRWNSYGLNAYKQIYIDGEKAGVQLQQFVRFDQFGIYGLQNQNSEEEFKPQTVTEVWERANFGLTWEGFFLKNKYGAGTIEISSDKDINVSDGIVDRIRIGKIDGEGSEESPYVFGIRIKDAKNNDVMITDSNGDLWLKNRLNIGVSKANSSVGIGTLDTIDTKHGREVINATNNFIVYEDGSMVAKDGNFTGLIYATGGKIGNLEISKLLNNAMVSIVASGTYFLNNSPETITLTAVYEGDKTNVQYKWYANGKELEGEINETLVLTSASLGINTFMTYKVSVIDGAETYTSREIGVSREQIEIVGYDILTNTEEVLKYYENEENIDDFILSYDSLNFSVKDLTANEILDSKDRISIEFLLDNSEDIYSDLIGYNGAPAILTYNEQLKEFSLDLQLLKVAKDKKDSDENYIYSNGVRAASQALTDMSVLGVRISFLKGKSIVTVKTIIFRIAQSVDSAKLNVFSSSIVQTLRDKQVIFDSNGLTVKNGNFFIKNGDETVLRADGNGGLYIKGTVYATDGEFTGKITAKDSSFSGMIEASSGRIGGFIIGEKELYSTNNPTEDSKGNIIYNPSDAAIRLLGEEGKIIADTIELGTGATIKNYIKLNNSYICNPDVNGGTFLKIYNPETDKNSIELTNNGIFKLGNIILDGTKSTISGLNWNITPTVANFENVVAHGGTIENVVFKNQTTQTVGGIMIFKPTSKVEYVEDEISTIDETSEIVFKIKVEDIALFKENDIVMLNGYGISPTNGLIESIEENSNIVQIKVTGVLSNFEKEKITSITKLASLEEKITSNSSDRILDTSKSYILKDELLIGVNSNSYTNGAGQDQNLYRSGFTFIVPDLEENYSLNYNKLPNLFLGNLGSLSALNTQMDFPVSGYGLYAENVFLKGSLTTKIRENTFAGISTLRNEEQIDSNRPGERITFWAGASSVNTISKAPFRVTENGSLYASRGIFEGSVISNATIEGVDIYGLRLHGGTHKENEDGTITDNSEELSIYDTSRGIVFRDSFMRRKDGSIDLGNEHFRITSSGLTQGKDKKYFVKINNGVTDFFGRIFEGNLFKTSKLKIRDNDIVYYEENDIEDLPLKFGFNKKASNEYSFDFKIQNILVGQMNNKRVSFFEDTNLTNNMYLGDLSGEYMEYKKVKGGYDIYVNA